ncbi:MAG: MATE family efflux transporter [Bacteroidales bacterium]|nr:MATE family efflux transporter [Bacteroidales bacterium]
MKDLTTGNVATRILTFGWPFLFANLFQQLYNFVDGWVVGKFIGTEALAAVGASFPVIFILISLLIGISTGITIVVSQFFGAKQFDNVIKAINTFFVFIFISSLVMSALGIYFARDIFVALKLAPDVIDLAVDYLVIYLGGMIFMFGFYGTNAILRGMGDSKTPLYFTIFSTITNVVLDLVFVLYFDMGVKGVAYASVIAQGLAFIIITYVMNRNNNLIHFSFKNLKFDWDIFKKSIRIGLPTGMQQSFVAFGMVAIMGIVADFGTETVAAFSVAGRLDALASTPAMALAAALAAFVGQNIGANKMNRVRQGFMVSLVISAAMSLIVTAIVVLFGRPVMGFFTNDIQVIEIGYHYLLIVSSFYIVFSSMFITHGVLRGAGDTFIPMIITLLALWVLRIPFSWFLSREEIWFGLNFNLFGLQIDFYHFTFNGFGVDGIWWGIPLAWAFGFSASYIYYRTGRWKTKSIILHEEPAPEEIV